MCDLGYNPINPYNLIGTIISPGRRLVLHWTLGGGKIQTGEEETIAYFKHDQYGQRYSVELSMEYLCRSEEDGLTGVEATR